MLMSISITRFQPILGLFVRCKKLDQIYKFELKIKVVKSSICRHFCP